VFITLEGGEGAGKSTQAKLLAARLQANGHRVTLTREPGGSPGGEDIRQLLVTGDPTRWTPQAEALLNYAARDAHLQATIRPALQRADIVICDRFMDSTRAYQGHAGGCSLAFIDRLEHEIVGRTRPDLTFVFDLPPELGLKRAKGTEDRFERKGMAFHLTLRDAFLAIARAEPQRCVVIDAAQGLETVAEEVWRHVEQRLP
jgi:dTMP kinase